MRIYLLHILFIIQFFASPFLHAQRQPIASVETTQISENIYKIFVHNYVNMIVFTGTEGILLIDSGMEPIDLITAELKVYYQMAKKTITLIKPLIESGLSLSEISKLNPLKSWSDWDSSFFPGQITRETWIENIYSSCKL